MGKDVIFYLFALGKLGEQTTKQRGALIFKPFDRPFCYVRNYLQIFNSPTLLQNFHLKICNKQKPLSFSFNFVFIDRFFQLKIPF